MRIITIIVAALGVLGVGPPLARQPMRTTTAMTAGGGITSGRSISGASMYGANVPGTLMRRPRLCMRRRVTTCRRRITRRCRKPTSRHPLLLRPYTRRPACPSASASARRFCSDVGGRRDEDVGPRAACWWPLSETSPHCINVTIHVFSR